MDSRIAESVLLVLAWISGISAIAGVVLVAISLTNTNTVPVIYASATGTAFFWWLLTAAAHSVAVKVNEA